MNFLTFLLSRKYIKIKYRTIIIKFIHEIYLGQEIKNNEIFNELYPNSEEYYQIMKENENDNKEINKNENGNVNNDNKNNNNDNGKNNNINNIEMNKNNINNKINKNFDDYYEEFEEEEDNLDKKIKFSKLNNLNILKVYLIFIINELDIMIKVLLEEDEKDRLDLGVLYLNELIFGIKLIGDIFISNDITSYITLWFFELVKTFLCKSYFIKKFY